MSTPLPQFEMSRREPPGAELTRKMLGYLLSGALEPGQRIPSERQLAEALSVGRAAVRETIKSLVILGLLDQRQGDGTYLSKSSSDLLPKVIEWGLLLGERRVGDLVETRHHVEIVLAGLAAERRSEADVAALRQIVEQMRAAGSDLDGYVELDIAFHLRIAAASGNPVLSGVLENVQALLRVWAARVIGAAGETETSLARHVPVLEAIERRDVEGARAAMTAHMERAGRRLRQTVEAGTEVTRASGRPR